MSEIRFASLNILAPELLAYFWRSSYCLPIPSDTNTVFGAFTRARLELISKHLRATNADVIALQETSNTVFESLGGKTSAEFLANELGYNIASSCLKDSPVAYRAPPYEQESKDSLVAFTGVATLYNPKTVEHVAHKSCATSVSASSPEGLKIVGSPHVADEFRPLSNKTNTNTSSLSQPALGIIFVNTHFRMSPYPHISNAFVELFARLCGGLDSISSSSSLSSLPSLRCSLFPACPQGSKCDLVHSTLSIDDISKRLVLVGDLNACHSIAHADLDECIQSLRKNGIYLNEVTPFKDILLEEPSIAAREASGQHTLAKECSYGEECRRKNCAYKHSFGLRIIDKRTNDRIFVSGGDPSQQGGSTKLSVVQSSAAHMPQLNLASKSVSRGSIWGLPDTLYDISPYNERLLRSKSITSDHPLITVDVSL